MIALLSVLLAAAPLHADIAQTLEAAAASEVAAVPAGRPQGTTLYITAPTSDFYFDPAATEATFSGIKTDEQKTIHIGLVVQSALQRITAAKGSELNRGETVVFNGVESADGEWILVTRGASAGWIRKADVTHPRAANWAEQQAAGVETAFGARLVERDQRRHAFVAEALSHEGKEYVWGGRSPASGFDCSGLVQYSFDKVWPGNDVPRVSRDQQSAARPVGSASELRTGDLVFTGDPVKHVMIFVEDGELIEAMGRKWGVRRSQLNKRIGGNPHFFGTYFED